MIKKYRKKPVVIEAIQWNGSNAFEIWNDFEDIPIRLKEEGTLLISTLEGDHIASIGDKDKDNYCLYFDVDYKRLEIDYNHRFKYDLSYFGDGENIKEFISVVGEERIKKYMFNVWE